MNDQTNPPAVANDPPQPGDSPPPQSGLNRWLWPLQSRKVQVALATLIVAYAAHAGIFLSDETVTSVLAMGAALVLGIAHEDHGKAAAKR